MKIVSLHTDFRIYWPARLQALHTALNKRGDTLEVIEIAGEGSHYAFSKKEQQTKLPWHILFPKKKPENLKGNTIKRKLFPLLDTLNPDVIIAGAIAFPSGALAVAWGKINNKKVIVFDDAKIEAVQRNPVVNFIKKAVYNGVDAMLYPAPDWEETGKYWNFKKEQLFYGVDVVDNDFWGCSSDLKYKWGKYFVSVGRQIPKKNYFLIAQAYVRYRKEIGNDAFGWVLIGDGPEHKRIAKFIHENHCEDKVHFLPFLSQTELPTIYQHAEALICCSNNEETWGLVINEAMAGGCPVIASIQCGATNTLVHDGINGFQFSCNDVDKLTELMLTYHRLPLNKKNAMKEASKQIISDWGLDRFAKGCCNAIDFVKIQPKRKISIINNLIIRLWKGRYRPI